MTDAAIRLTLHLSRDGGTIAGEVEDEHGDARAFHGWMDLAARLEAGRRVAEAESECDAPSA
jgi:hypothetical protein